MFKVFIDGNDDRLRLEDLEGREVGWIRGHTIGFGGLPSEKIALRAVPEAWMALETTLQRGYPGRAPRPVKKSNIDVVHDGAYEWVADGFRPLARLMRPHTGRNSEASYALEFMVPSYATQHVTIAAAQAVWQVLSEYIPVCTDGESRQASTSDQELDSPALAVGGQ
jgi:hypothetical protein